MSKELKVKNVPTENLFAMISYTPKHSTKISPIVETKLAKVPSKINVLSSESLFSKYFRNAFLNFFVKC